MLVEKHPLDIVYRNIDMDVSAKYVFFLEGLFCYPSCFVYGVDEVLQTRLMGVLIGSLTLGSALLDCGETFLPQERRKYRRLFAETRLYFAPSIDP